MSEWIVRVIRLDRLPRLCGQHVFDAASAQAAERFACKWAAELFGGHSENYDAQAIPLSQWSAAPAIGRPMDFTGDFT